MSVGGIIGTVPSAAIVTALGWALFNPPVAASWGAVALTFALTIASLYAMGMMLSAAYLVYGREAESMNEVLQEPVSMLSGVYFPSIGISSPFPLAIQAAASLIPLTIGMDALRRSLFGAQGVADVWPSLLLLGAMALLLLAFSTFTLKALEKKGRGEGTITVRIR